MNAHRFNNRDLARIAVFTAILAAFSFIRIPIGPVPITMQTLAVMLAGTVLGPWLGALSVLLLLALVLIGLPLLGGNGGFAVFVGPTAGYLLGFVLGALVVGLIAHHGHRLAWWKTALACLCGGMLIPYLCGVPVTALILGQSLANTAWSALPFVPGDIVKIVLATVITGALWKAYPAAFPQSLREKHSLDHA
jgi:biotin transport system substrate-specific component